MNIVLPTPRTDWWWHKRLWRGRETWVPWPLDQMFVPSRNKTFDRETMQRQITLQPVTTDSRDYAAIEALFVRAFPENERRDLDAQAYNVDSDSVPMTCYAAYCKATGEFAGFVTVWTFDGYRYLEHLATSEGVRNGGIGGAMVDAVAAMAPDEPIVLEVEPESYGEMACRRIGFYERHGLRLWRGRDYMQPPYRPGGEHVRLMIMATDGLDAERDFDRVVGGIISRVYPK